MSEQIDYQAFRNEVEAFVQKNCPQDIRKLVAENRKLSREPWSRWQKILHQHGWGAPNWPKELGGTGWNPKQQAIYGEVLAENDCPAQYHHGLRHIGPVLKGVVPNVVGLSAKDAVYLIENIGMYVSIKGYGTVVRQSSPAGTPSFHGGLIELTLE